jgi:hypothetical protein
MKAFGELKVGEVFSLNKPFDPEDYWVKRSSRTADMHMKPYPPRWFYFSKKERVYTPKA